MYETRESIPPALASQLAAIAAMIPEEVKAQPLPKGAFYVIGADKWFDHLEAMAQDKRNQ